MRLLGSNLSRELGLCVVYICVCGVVTGGRCCCSADMGHSGRREERDERAINGVRVTDSRGEGFFFDRPV